MRSPGHGAAIIRGHSKDKSHEHRLQERLYELGHTVSAYGSN